MERVRKFGRGKRDRFTVSRPYKDLLMSPRKFPGGGFDNVRLVLVVFFPPPKEKKVIRCRPSVIVGAERKIFAAAVGREMEFAK